MKQDEKKSLCERASEWFSLLWIIPRAISKIFRAKEQSKAEDDEEDEEETIMSSSNHTKSANISGTAGKKPLQVYILLGQSNMVGMGRIGNEKNNQDGNLYHAVHNKGLYQYLINDNKSWKNSENVRYVYTTGSGIEKTKIQAYGWMGVANVAKTIGPELGMAHTLTDDDSDTPVLVLKSCIGNRALGWDLLPPGSEGFEYTDRKGKTWLRPGYHGTPERWEKGSKPDFTAWYAGIQYDGDVRRAKEVLNNLDEYYPGVAPGDYQVAGFFWWQGDRDMRDEGLCARYQINLTNLIKQLRVDFNCPFAKFVCGSLGQTVIGDGKVTGDKLIFDAMLECEKDPQFEGTVACVYTHPYSKGGSSSSHYNGNAETYMNIGEAMGSAMAKLEQKSA